MKRWLLLLLIVAAAFAFVVVPFFLIQPFKPQTERGLAVGYEVRRFAPWATVALAVVALVLVARMWRASRRWWAKALMVLLLVPVAASVLGVAAERLRGDVQAARRARVRARRRRWTTSATRTWCSPSSRRRARRVPRPADGLSPHRRGHGRRRADRRHLLNALSHRSGVGDDGRRAGADFRLCGHQQPELHHARRRDRLVVAAGLRRVHLRAAEGQAAEARSTTTS